LSLASKRGKLDLVSPQSLKGSVVVLLMAQATIAS
jgi:hypothetical protein